MAWKITHDLLTKSNEEGCHVGFGVNLEQLKETPVPERITFRLLDDDLEHYYTGVANRDAYEDDDPEDGGGLYDAYNWAMYDSGCTHLLLKLEDVLSFGKDERMAQINRDLAFKTGPHKGWVSIYG